MRTIGLTVIATDHLGNEIQGDVVLDATLSGPVARTRFADAISAAMRKLVEWRGGSVWEDGQIGLYLELVNVDDRLAGFVRLHEETACSMKFSIANRINWTETTRKAVK